MKPLFQLIANEQKVQIMKVGIVIPAYNEAQRLGKVLGKVKKHIGRYHICVIDDGSDDRTSGAAKRAGVRCIRFPENRGKGEALKAGFQWAMDQGLDAVITMDADGQHDPAYIPEFIKAMQVNRCDVVLGTRRFHPGEMPLDRILSNRISSFLVSLAAQKKIQDSQSGYRMFRLSVLKGLPLRGKLYELESEMLIRLGRKNVSFGSCRIPAAYEGAPSHIRRWRDIRRFVNMWLHVVFERKEIL
ncbi:glycosyltransferase family 2 protein [bacterium]|nr:glycosyltransferase family 2 protein [bacterium]